MLNKYLRNGPTSRGLESLAGFSFLFSYTFPHWVVPTLTWVRVPVTPTAFLGRFQASRRDLSSHLVEGRCVRRARRVSGRVGVQRRRGQGRGSSTRSLSDPLRSPISLSLQHPPHPYAARMWRRSEWRIFGCGPLPRLIKKKLTFVWSL